mgnify:CR=1 FL=1
MSEPNAGDRERESARNATPTTTTTTSRAGGRSRERERGGEAPEGEKEIVTAALRVYPGASLARLRRSIPFALLFVRCRSLAS